ncbi:uncharacterized protein [Epargyreus clarus]|uniref:uncharacterized protein n=1 Tax=Epargyreus clarus TaxID=520877 RepID=UPI003C2FBD17
MSEKKVRYSVGPVKKHAVKTTPNTEEENVYESMERIAETAPRAKSTPSPVISPRNETINRSLRARPKLPLPHELQALEYEDMRGNRGPQTSTGLTLPPGIQSPLMEGK